MSSRPFYLRFEIFLGVGILWVLSFLWLAPPIEEGVSEVRVRYAYRQVRLLHRDYSGELPEQMADLEERDPWGQPYRLTLLDDGGFRVMSAGPNETFDDPNASSDDIFTGMPHSPLEPFARKRNRQLLVALILPTLLCAALLTLAYFANRD